MDKFSGDPTQIWESNIFGRSFHELVNEDLQAKLYRMGGEGLVEQRPGQLELRRGDALPQVNGQHPAQGDVLLLEAAGPPASAGTLKAALASSACR